jgi:hypothetical protein
MLTRGEWQMARGNRMDLVSLGDNAHLSHVQEQSMKRVIAILESVSEKQRVPEPEMLTAEYKEQLSDRIADCLKSGAFLEAKDLIMRLNLIDLHITQTYADMDAGVKQKLDALIDAARAERKPISRAFLTCAAERYQRIIDRMDLDSQSGNPALVEYLNIYATVLELLGNHEEAQQAHERIPAVMVLMLEQQKSLAAKFCLSEKQYWDEQIALLQEENCLGYEQLQTATKALRFYEHKEAMLCALTHDEPALEEKLKELRALVLGTKAA